MEIEQEIDTLLNIKPHKNKRPYSKSRRSYAFPSSSQHTHHQPPHPDNTPSSSIHPYLSKHLSKKKNKQQFIPDHKEERLEKKVTFTPCQGLSPLFGSSFIFETPPSTPLQASPLPSAHFDPSSFPKKKPKINSTTTTFPTSSLSTSIQRHRGQIPPRIIETTNSLRLSSSSDSSSSNDIIISSSDSNNNSADMKEDIKQSVIIHTHDNNNNNNQTEEIDLFSRTSSSLSSSIHRRERNISNNSSRSESTTNSSDAQAIT